MALLAEQPPKIRLYWFVQVDHTLKQDKLGTTLICLSLKLKIEAEIFNGDEKKTKHNRRGEAAVCSWKTDDNKRGIRGFISQLMRGLLGCNSHCACPTSSTLNALNELLC